MLDFAELNDCSVLDCHIHFGHPSYRPSLIEILDKLNIVKFNIVCTPEQTRLSLVPDALHIKAHHPERVYVFGGMDISPLFMAPDQAGEIWAGYIDTLLAMGCDGVKMIEGKPQMRKMLPIPDFDSDVYAPYWAKLAERNVPLLFHVNDPEEFWDADRAPAWAHERGWFYGDGSFVNNEKQYTQVLNVMERHPDLHVIFAHFFFLSAQLPRLGDYLDRFPNMVVDLTPGIEMYTNFAQNLVETQEFFIKYQDRILFGTDIGAKALLATPEQGIEYAESAARVEVIRSFLEVDGEFAVDDNSGFLFGRKDVPFRGIGLPAEVLKKIYSTNFERMAGEKPRELDPGAIVGECERLTMMIAALGSATPDEPGDPTIAQEVKTYFATQMT